MIMDTGRVCLKIAGRDSGHYAVIVNKIDNNYVLIDGNVRRKKCNIKHLEPTSLKLNIKQNASTEDIKKALAKANLKVIEKKQGTKERKEKQKPVRKRKAGKTKAKVKVEGKNKAAKK